MKLYGPTQFAIFRIVFGIYLTYHFADLIPIGEEIFSNNGVINNSTILPSYGKLPILLLYDDSPSTVNIFICSLVVASILFTCGIFRRICSFWLYYGWISLLNRNPLISNPGTGYIGWILLACATIPTGESLRFLLSPEKRKNLKTWEFPDIIYYGMWTIIGISYTASGIHKLQCETWLDGTALWYVLTGPLVRQNNFIVDIILSNMLFIKLLTWGSLFLEISCLFLGTFYRTRRAYWIMFMGFHLGILSTVNFADLTIGMIIPHLFTFDCAWFPFTKKFIEKYDLNGVKINEFDINHSDKFNSKTLKQHIKENITKSISQITESTPNNSKYITGCIITVLIAIFVKCIYTNEFLYKIINRFAELTLDAYWGFGIMIFLMGFFMILERLFPDQKLNYVHGWWKWVIIINVFQLFSVIFAMFTWEHWLQNTSYFTNAAGFHLRDHVSPLVGGLIAYLINQWLFYHWHKARHHVYWLWVLCHQFHHSPTRIETITSFYKHPLEIMIDSQIMAILLYSVLGLSNESSIWLSIFSCVGEYIYHMNIKTPQILGYFFQRPESHRCHHRRNKRINCPNYSDFPLWDILGGTFENPERMDDPTGFSKETKRIDMLFFKDVITSARQDIFSSRKKFKRTCLKFVWYVLVIWGTINSTAFVAHYDGVKDLGFASGSSPLPLVFSAYNGYETYATGFNATIKYADNTRVQVDLGVERYSMMTGAYNRRNVYGAIFSHGPFFNKENLILMRQNILKYAVCDPRSIIKDFKLYNESNPVISLHVDVLYRPRNNTIVSVLDIEC